jgi:hypothetical protein
MLGIFQVRTPRLHWSQCLYRLGQDLPNKFKNSNKKFHARYMKLRRLIPGNSIFTKDNVLGNPPEYNLSNYLYILLKTWSKIVLLASLVTWSFSIVINLINNGNNIANKNWVFRHVLIFTRFDKMNIFCNTSWNVRKFYTLKMKINCLRAFCICRKSRIYIRE